VKWWILPLAMMLAGGAQAKSWQVRPDGLGPYKVGARYENLGKTFGGLQPAVKSEDFNCMVAQSKRYPNVRVTFVRKVVARVDIAGGFASDRGVRVGDPFAKLLRVYGDAVKPHPEHADWMMVSTGSGELATRYMMRAGRVAAIHAGQRPLLQAQNGCK